MLGGKKRWKVDTERPIVSACFPSVVVLIWKRSLMKVDNARLVWPRDRDWGRDMSLKVLDRP